jgi:hypothetical protein
MSTKKFCVTKGQLLIVKTLSVESQDFITKHILAVARHNYECDWEFVVSGAHDLNVVLEGGAMVRVAPKDTIFITDMSEEEIRNKTLDILLSI